MFLRCSYNNTDRYELVSLCFSNTFQNIQAWALKCAPLASGGFLAKTAVRCNDWQMQTN